MYTLILNRLDTINKLYKIQDYFKAYFRLDETACDNLFFTHGINVVMAVSGFSRFRQPVSAVDKFNDLVLPGKRLATETCSFRSEAREKIAVCAAGKWCTAANFEGLCAIASAVDVLSTLCRHPRYYVQAR